MEWECWKNNWKLISEDCNKPGRVKCKRTIFCLQRRQHSQHIISCHGEQHEREGNKIQNWCIILVVFYCYFENFLFWSCFMSVNSFLLLYIFLFPSIPGQRQDKFDQLEAQDMRMIFKSFSVQFWGMKLLVI